MPDESNDLSLLSTRSQLLAVWITLVSVAVIFVGFWLVAGYVAPPAAHDTAQEVAAFYREDTDRIRIGLTMTILGFTGWGTFVAAIATQLRRIEPRRPLFTYLQLASGVGWVFLLFPFMVLLLASFRPDRAAADTQLLHDLGWGTAFLPVVPFCVQALSISAAIFKDRSPTPVFPRWVAYFSGWAALLFTPGFLLVFFKTGPFAYHGLLVYWVPTVVFGLWIVVIAWTVRRAVLDEASATAATSARRV